MDETLTKADIALLLESINYSQNNVRDSDTPYTLKREKLNHMEEVARKLRQLRESTEE